MIKLSRITVARCFLLTAVGFLPAACRAGEILYLTNGFTLEATSHSARGEAVVVQTTSGTFEVPASTIERIDKLADPPPPIMERTIVHESVAPPQPDLESILSSAANSQGLSPSFVRSVAKVESNLRPDAVSPVGAVGLMQLMPGTAADLGVSPQDVGQNAAGGAQYLRQLLMQYHGDAALALAAYNAGPAAVAKYHGVPPYGETRRYVVRVLQEYIAEQQKTKTQAQLLAKAAKDKQSRLVSNTRATHCAAAWQSPDCQPPVSTKRSLAARPATQLASSAPVSGR